MQLTKFYFYLFRNEFPSLGKSRLGDFHKKSLKKHRKVSGYYDKPLENSFFKYSKVSSAFQSSDHGLFSVHAI